MIATLGSYEFEVSTNRVKTFKDLRISSGTAYAEHKIIGRKGVIEFTGLNASTASLSIALNASMGVNPLTEINAIRKLMEEHELLAFTLGGEVMGGGLWVIESLSIDAQKIDNKGNILGAVVNLTLKESAE